MIPMTQRVLILKVRLMERRLNEVEWSHPTSNQQQRSNAASTTTSAAGSTSNLFSGINEPGGELSVAEKDRIIRTLESEVEAQVDFFYLI